MKPCLLVEILPVETDIITDDLRVFKEVRFAQHSLQALYSAFQMTEPV